MSKLKIKPGLIGILLLASLFAGWETLLIVTVLILLFCEMNDTIKKIMVSVISFFIGYTLVSLLWQIISDGIGVVIYAFNQFIEFLNYYLTTSIDVSKLTNYVLNPIQNVISTLNEVITYLLIIAKFCFIICTLAKKTINIPIISKYVNKVLNYINSSDSNDTSNEETQNQPSNNQVNNMNNNFANQQVNNQQYVNNQSQPLNNNPQFTNVQNQQVNPDQFNNFIN